MSNRSQNSEDKIIVHSTESGKLYVNEEEFFRNKVVKEKIIRMLSSNLYKALKGPAPKKQPTH